MQAYSNPDDASDTGLCGLPDIEVFQLTAAEVVEMDEDLMWEYNKCPEFRLAAMNSKVREAMFDAMIEQRNITGGWFWWACFPGCLPDSSPIGPFATYGEALADAQEECDE